VDVARKAASGLETDEGEMHLASLQFRQDVACGGKFKVHRRISSVLSFVSCITPSPFRMGEGCGAMKKTMTGQLLVRLSPMIATFVPKDRDRCRDNPSTHYAAADLSVEAGLFWKSRPFGVGKQPRLQSGLIRKRPDVQVLVIVP
jgi:hypothetical protein